MNKFNLGETVYWFILNRFITTVKKGKIIAMKIDLYDNNVFYTVTSNDSDLDSDLVESCLYRSLKEAKEETLKKIEALRE